MSIFTPEERDAIGRTFDRTQLHGTIRRAAEQEAKRLRQALPRETGAFLASAGGEEVVYRIYRPTLRCRIGLHRWKYFARVLWVLIDMGDRMKRCEQCGKTRRA